jgi:TolB-like protein
MDINNQAHCQILSMKKFLLFPLIFVVLLLCSGCSTTNPVTTTYVRQDVDLTYITKVAVLPFVNNTNDDFSGERIRDIASTQVLAMSIFDVIGRGVVDSGLREMAIENDTPLDVQLTKRLGNRLGVQGFILGTVNGVGEQRRGSFNYTEVSLTLELIDAESALVLWRNSDTLSGYSLTDRLFGLAPLDAFQVTVDLLRKILATIPR